MIYRGVRTLSPRTIRLHAFFLVPLIFVVWGLYDFALTPKTETDVLLFCAVLLLTFFIGGGLAFLQGAPRLNAEGTKIRLAGSPISLILIVAIIFVKYILNALKAMHPEEALYRTLLMVSGGLFTGLFQGLRIFRYLRARKEPREEL